MEQLISASPPSSKLYLFAVVQLHVSPKALWTAGCHEVAILSAVLCFALSLPAMQGHHSCMIKFQNVLIRLPEQQSFSSICDSVAQLPCSNTFAQVDSESIINVSRISGSL